MLLLLMPNASDQLDFAIQQDRLRCAATIAVPPWLTLVIVIIYGRYYAFWIITVNLPHNKKKKKKIYFSVPYIEGDFEIVCIERKFLAAD